VSLSRFSLNIFILTLYTHFTLPFLGAKSSVRNSCSCNANFYFQLLVLSGLYAKYALTKASYNDLPTFHWNFTNCRAWLAAHCWTLMLANKMFSARHLAHYVFRLCVAIDFLPMSTAWNHLHKMKSPVSLHWSLKFISFTIS